MKRLFALAALLALAACTVDLATGSAGPQPSGGAAGALGRNYCGAVPTDPRERWRWNDLCFPGL